MKAVIMAAGEGKRLKPITSSRPKPMIPLVGKPLLEHTILGLKDAGIDEILLIVGYKENVIKEYFKDGIEGVGIKIEYITQKQFLGTANAASYAKDFAKDEKFLMMYGDLLIEPIVFKELLQQFNENPTEGLISLVEVKNPQDFGIISLNSDGLVEKITEKPPLGMKLGNLANAGVFIFDPIIFKAIEKTKKSVRGEFEFTDSMDILIHQMKGKVQGFVLKNRFWSDIGLPWQLFDANNYLLDRIEHKILGTVEENVHMSGKVYIGNKSIIKSGTYIEGPCYIGENNLIGPHAYLRPYTSVENNCHIGKSETKNAIIFSNSAVPHFNYVGDSIICEKVNLGAGTKTSNLRFDNKSVKMNINGKLVDSGRRKLGAIIGPNSQTGINSSIMCGKIIYENCAIGAHTIVLENVEANTLYYQDPNEGIVKKSNKFL